jgi:superfamily II DNA or RNA helicase
MNPIRILVDNVWGRFVGPDWEKIDKSKRGDDTLIKMGVFPASLFHHFQVKDPDAHWQQMTSKFDWAPVQNFISANTGKFGIGLLGDIISFIESQGWPFEIHDTRQQLPIDPDVIKADMLDSDYHLRYYQLDATKACAVYQNGMIKKPTGSGKTLDLAALSLVFNKLADGSSPRILVLMDKKTLARQTIKQFIKYGIAETDLACVVGQSEKAKPSPYTWNEEKVEKGARIVVAIRQMIHVLKDAMPTFDVLLMDEAHHASSTDNRKLLAAAKNARVRLGFSGTPFSGHPIDDMYRRSLFGPVIYEISTAQLIKEEFLAKPFIKFIDVQRRDSTMFNAMGYKEVYEAGIVDFDFRNYLIAKIARNMAGRTLILFLRIRHGEMLMRKLGAPGRPEANNTDPYLLHNKKTDQLIYVPEVPVFYLDGDWGVKYREKVVKQYNAQHHAILLASPIFDEGVDLPGVNTLIVAGGEKSYVKTIQRLGRALRPNNSGIVYVWDFWDGSHDILQRHSLDRHVIWGTEGHNVEVIKLMREDGN